MRVVCGPSRGMKLNSWCKGLRIHYILIHGFQHQFPLVRLLIRLYSKLKSIKPCVFSFNTKLIKSIIRKRIRFTKIIQVSRFPLPLLKHSTAVEIKFSDQPPNHLHKTTARQWSPYSFVSDSNPPPHSNWSPPILSSISDFKPRSRVWISNRHRDEHDDELPLFVSHSHLSVSDNGGATMSPSPIAPFDFECDSLRPLFSLSISFCCWIYESLISL